MIVRALKKGLVFNTWYMIMKTVSKEKIDFIVYWVDGSDEQWLQKKNQYAVANGQDSKTNRYRDWENLKYLFRGIEKFAPWVNHVYFVSDEQIPEWMRTDNPKLKIVSHKDYIPKRYLPTFNSNPIELNFHRIEELSEYFVVFNDDCFITNKISKEDFFVDGKPKDIFMEYPVMCGGNTIAFSNILVNIFNLIGKHFERKEYKKRLAGKMLSLKYGRYFFYNLLIYMIPFPRFFGLLTPHFARPYLKSSYEEVWKLEEERLDEVCKHRFRDKGDINIYVFRLWNLLKGNFVPANIFKMGKAYMIYEEDVAIYEAIEKQRYKLLCLNDECKDEDFDRIKNRINDSFEKILGEKCSFEK